VCDLSAEDRAGGFRPAEDAPVAGLAWTLQFLRILVTFCEPSIYMKFFTIFIPYFGDLVNHVTVGVTLNWYNQGVINGGEGTPSYQGAPSMVHTVKGWP